MNTATSTRRQTRVVSDMVRIANGMNVLHEIKANGPQVLLRRETREMLFAETSDHWTGWHYLASLGNEVGARAKRIMFEDKEILGLTATCDITVESLLRRD